MPAGNKREQIMGAVEKLFTSRRFHEVTLDDVAQAAGVGKGTIYRYFEDKDDLFFQTAISGFDDLCALLRGKKPEDTPFGEELLSACVEISTFFDRRRQLLRMIQVEEGRMHWCEGSIRERWMAHRKKLVAAVGEIIARGMAEGEIRSDISAEVLAGFLLGMLRTRAHDFADAPEGARRYELIVDLFCRGVCCSERPGEGVRKAIY